MPKKTTKKVAKKSVKKSAKKPVKKSVKKTTPSVKKTVTAREGKVIGRVTHYFSEIGVAVLKIASPIKEGDDIRIVGGDKTDFTQKALSMEIDHEKVTSVKKGDDVGLKVKEKVREGYKVFKP